MLTRVARAHILAIPSALCSLMVLLPAPRASAADCLPGHNTVVTPCTFDSGYLSLDSSTSSGGGGGHHTLVSFPFSSFGAGIQVAADIGGGYPPYSATDGGGTSTMSSLTLQLTATSPASAQIQKLRFVLINPQVSGAGSISWTFGNGTPPGSVSGDQTITTGDLIFGSPVSTTTETISATLSTGGSGSATVDGYAIYVPEPGKLALFGTGLALLPLLKRRRRPGSC